MKPLQVSASPPQVPLHKALCVWAMDVAGLSADDVNDAPSIPEVLPTSERPPPCHDHLHEEENMDYSCSLPFQNSIA